MMQRILLLSANSLSAKFPLPYGNPLTYRPPSSVETGSPFLESAGERESQSPPLSPNPLSGQPTIDILGTDKEKEVGS
ncbi:hypothetical protein HNY73_004644 [Argiope bruennichi]|uniref:Uncharacterized protein n=1 Tax=Argiope bruennichi TaxID=94029 RepID=A0A8T0FPU8_ARGBR|nr:hypothetical protein HNY73_004644 [Argiope bruennichi]